MLIVELDIECTELQIQESNICGNNYMLMYNVSFAMEIKIVLLQQFLELLLVQIGPMLVESV